MIKFTWLAFAELNLDQLYAILHLRAQVFVVEQQCIYQDIDYADQQALHLLGMENSQLVAYLRVFPPNAKNPEVTFGSCHSQYGA